MSFTYFVKMQQQALAVTEMLLPPLNSTRDSGEKQIEWKDFFLFFL